MAVKKTKTKTGKSVKPKVTTRTSAVAGGRRPPKGDLTIEIRPLTRGESFVVTGPCGQSGVTVVGPPPIPPPITRPRESVVHLIQSDIRFIDERFVLIGKFVK